MIVALTGGIASGKTTVANIFADQGIDCIDADVIARHVVEPGKPALEEIKSHFGDDIIFPDGTLNRRKLREQIFKSSKQRKWLETCLHPRIRHEIMVQLATSKSPYTLLIVPLLVENGLHKLADRVLVVDISPEDQLKRVCIRDKVSADQAKAIISSQATREQRLAIADDVIVNSHSLKSLQSDAFLFHKKYLQLAKDHDSSQNTL
ncbi:MAG: Dephospho-CoA kinase [Candidatus Celerinatantimonas neptuna]|nr:MAG: Dephospho-CoA kinase [Candidatus Celerinatantimonas neptuna]